MDQVLHALNELHQRAASAIHSSLQHHGASGDSSSSSSLERRSARRKQPQQQQLPSLFSDSRGACITSTSSPSSSSSSSTTTSPKRRVHFAPPFAALSPLGRTSGASPGSSDNSSKASKKLKKQQEDEEEERILISEVEVVGVSEALKRVAYEALTTRPNFAYTLKEVEADLKRVFATGWFSSCVPDAEDTRDGVKLVIKVTANPELRGVVARGASMLPTRVVERAFKPLYGQPLNFVAFGKAVKRLDDWYQQRGILGQVVDFGFESGIVDLQVGEATVGSVDLTFLDPKTNSPKTQGATKPSVIQRHLTTQPGRVYNLRQAKADIDSIYSTGLFEDVNIVPQEAEDSTETQPKVDLTINLVERKTGGLGAGTGISAAGRAAGNMPGFVGNFTYSERNFLGLNQKLSALVELGQADSLFRLQYVDPWIHGDPNRTSRTLSIMNTRTSAAAIHGQALDTEAAAAASGGGAAGTAAAGESGSGAAAAAEERGGAAAAGGGGPADSVTLGRLVAGAEWRRPLAANWSGTAGVTWQRSSCIDSHGCSLLSDAYGAPLTFSGQSSDSSFMGLASMVYSPTDGSQVAASAEVALPLRPSWLGFTRLRMRAEQPLSIGPLDMNFRVKAGGVHGDLPPYEAFPLGGTNSVRGYAEGGVGSGRHFVEGSAELRWPLAKPVCGVLFLDYGTDLDSGESVLGDPAGTRGKPGSGYGYGAGIRLDSPLGPVRLEYAWNDQRSARFHVALGYD